MIFHLRLKAQQFERNINRDYEIAVYKVLLGFWGVVLAFGRQGKKGDSRNYVFATLQEAQQFVRKTLQKRLRAPKRIGCPYFFVSVKVDSQETLTQWLSPLHQQALNYRSPSLMTSEQKEPLSLFPH
jgi:excinuclease UvrABC nuclease subunit